MFTFNFTDALKQIKGFTENLKCSICQEIFIDPVVIVCGHNFCKHCIEEWHKNFIKENPYEEPCPCPECRTLFKTVYPNISLKNFITDLSAVILDKEEKRKREETIKERLEKKDNTPISGGAGDKIFSLAYIAEFLSAPNVFDVAATPAPADMDTAVAGVGAIQGEEPNRCIHCCECELRGNRCTHTTLCINCSQLLTERQQNIQEQAENQVNQSHPYPIELIHASSYLYQGQAPALEQTPVVPTLPRSQLLSAPNTPSLAPQMNLVEPNIQGHTPVLGQTPVAPTLPGSQLLSAPNAPSLAPPMNLVESDSTTSDVQYFPHFNGRATTRILPRPSPYSRPRRPADLWNPL